MVIGFLDLKFFKYYRKRINIFEFISSQLRLKFRYHSRNCDLDIDEDDASRCIASKRENVAAKDQLAKLIYNEQ